MLTHLGVELRAEVEPLLHELDNVATRFSQRMGRRRVLRISVTPFFASECSSELERVCGEPSDARSRIETTELARHPRPGALLRFAIIGAAGRDGLPTIVRTDARARGTPGIALQRS